MQLGRVHTHANWLLQTKLFNDPGAHEDPWKEELERWAEGSCLGELTAVSGTAHQKPLLTLGKVEEKEETGMERHPKGGWRELETENDAKPDESQTEAFLRLERDNDST